MLPHPMVPPAPALPLQRCLHLPQLILRFILRRTQRRRRFHCLPFFVVSGAFILPLCHCFMANVAAQSERRAGRGGREEAGEGRAAIPLIALSALLDGRAICTQLVSIVRQAEQAEFTCHTKFGIDTLKSQPAPNAATPTTPTCSRMSPIRGQK